MTINIATIPTPARDVRIEEVEGELLLYHPAQTMAVYLNPPAAIIWGLCDGRRDVAEIIQLIEESYPESKPDLRNDVLDTLTQLYDNQLLTD